MYKTQIPPNTIEQMKTSTPVASLIGRQQVYKTIGMADKAFIM